MADQHVWRKSSHSGGGQDCVEVAAMPDVVAVRDSKDRGGPTLAVPADAWAVFADAVKAGRYSR